MNDAQERARRRRTRNLAEDIWAAKRDVHFRAQRLDSTRNALQRAEEHLAHLQGMKPKADST